MRTNLRTPRTVPLRDAQGMFFGWLLGGGCGWVGLRPRPCPWAGDPTPLGRVGQRGTLTHHFHGNP